MGFLQRLFGTRKDERPAHHAVLVHLDGIGLPDNIYQECDTATLEDKLIAILDAKGLGEFDGTESGSKETTVFLYGPDADKLFAGIEATLRAYPLCKGARVVLRYGGAGATEKELKL